MDQEYKQIKSRAYYIFWGTATLAVVIGQMAIAGGYRRLSETIDRASWRVVDSVDFNLQRLSRPRLAPLAPIPYQEPVYKEMFIEPPMPPAAGSR